MKPKIKIHKLKAHRNIRKKKSIQKGERVYMDFLFFAGASLRFEMVECWKNAIEQGLVN